eukprot:jgi/Picsp_1/5555/NSC_02914-R1_alpha beta-hydrolase domain-containing protein
MGIPIKIGAFVLVVCLGILVQSASGSPRRLGELNADFSVHKIWIPIWNGLKKDIAKWLWWHESGSLLPVNVTPLLPDGRRASTAQLWLPRSQINREYLEEDLESKFRFPWPGRGSPESIPWYTYNSSKAAYLVPGSLAWMLNSDQMQDRADGGFLDIDVARSVSGLVAASYCSPENLKNWNCSRCEDSFTLERVAFDPLWDLQGFTGWSDDLNAVVIAFRGTDSRSYYNWVENMKTWRTDLSPAYEGMPRNALVHGGFFYSYNSSFLAGNVTEAVESIIARRRAHPRGGGSGSGGSWGSFLGDENLGATPTVFVSGHSLGGALATLCAMDLKLRLKVPDVRLVTFGSPRVGNAVFAHWFNKFIAPHWRFTHNRDVVPSVPPQYMGFSHVAQEIWVVDFNYQKTLVGICDGSGEDPKCHNSVCHLGLCSSLADHLLYLSEMYTPRPEGC